MSAADEYAGEPGGDDIVAAEYVLGVLPADERREATLRLERDRAFAAAVEAWEAHFAPLAASYAEAAPPTGVKAALDRRLFASTASTAGEPVKAGGRGLWANLAFWRSLSAASIAGLALTLGISLLPPVHPDTPRMVASLQGEGSDVRYVALYDETRHEVALSKLSGETGANRDFELWMIEQGKAPASVGIIPAGSTISIELSLETQRKLAAGGVLAISLEPAGGSPTGQPTGPVVASGDLRSI